MRYGMMIELDRCVGCKACVSACKERWDSGPGVSRDWVKEFESGTRETGLDVTFYPGLCMHCQAHPCTQDCPTGATFADQNGVVKVDADLCIGCGNCVSRCPYGARTADNEKGIVEKCNFCEPYVAMGEKPACVDACLAECRLFGDLDDPIGKLVEGIRTRGAKTLTTEALDIGPKVYYAPAEKREKLLDNGAVGRSVPSTMTQVWTDGSRPAAQFGVPAIAALAGVGGLLINFRSRGANEPMAAAVVSSTSAPQGANKTLPRHRFGMRFLHWFNAFSWVLLLATGTALMATPNFALFGTGFAHAVAAWVGGAANLIWIHVAWGLLWAGIIVPFFLYFKRGGIEALQEIRLTPRDFAWLVAKPMALLRIGNPKLPPQDKYNAGQKLFAISALAGTATIIATGLIMALHLGPAWLVLLSVLVHKLAILLALVGLAVHITMAAIIVEERPALRSMVNGHVDRAHAEHHNAKWVEEIMGSSSGVSASSTTEEEGSSDGVENQS